MRRIIATLAALAIAAPVHALTATQTVEKEIVVQNADGSETATRVPADTVAPGDRVVYSVTVLNDTDEPADSLVLTQPVPSEVTYIEGSAERTGAELSVSVDGGETFTSRGSATVVRNGEALRASAEDITHLRWTLSSDLMPGTQDVVAYKGVLK